MLHLATWSSPAIIVVFVATMAGAMAAAPLLGRRLKRARDHEAAHRAAIEALSLVGSLTAVFLSFALVQSMGEYRRADAAVAHEAGDIVQLDRALAIVAQDAARPARLLLRAYTRAVLADEWPAMRANQPRVDSVEAAFTHLQLEIERLVRDSLHAEQAFQIVKSLDDLHDDRAARVGSATSTLPPVFWWAATGLLLLVVASAAGLQATRHWVVLAGTYGSALGILAACFYILDGPFLGDVSVSARPIAAAIASMDARMR